MCLPAILEIMMLLFVSSMATISAVIFIRPAGLPLASVAVIDMEDAGDTAPAAAMCILILVANLLARGFGELGLWWLERERRQEES